MEHIYFTVPRSAANWVSSLTYHTLSLHLLYQTSIWASTRENLIGHRSAVGNVSDYRYLSANPGVANSIPARYHTFVEIDPEIISTAILLPSADSRRVVSYKEKYVHKVLVNRVWMILANPRVVILYARSSYYHNNMFIIYIFLTFFSDFLNCCGLLSWKIARTFAITLCFLTLRHHVFLIWFHDWNLLNVMSPQKQITDVSLVLKDSFVCLFDLILYVPSTIFQLNRDRSSWVEPVLACSRTTTQWCRSPVKHSTTEPLRSL